MIKRRICYVTGTRAEYGLMCYSLKQINRVFDLKLIVTGMHLAKEFGYTFREIEKDGFQIYAKLDTLHQEDTGASMAKSFGQTVIGVVPLLEKIKPDFLLAFGDRGEMLAATIAAAYLNIPVAHIHGGDQGDNGAHIDEPTRHSITKFAHIHFAATKKSADRIVKMGEQPWRVHIVGTPGLDEIIHEKLYPKEYLEKKFNIDFTKQLFIVIQHAILTEVNMAGSQMKETMEALKQLRFPTILIYPNADAGSRKMIEIIKEYEDLPFLKTYKSLPRKVYLSLLKYATLMIGNSSSGSIDSPAFKLPVVNVGNRESTREQAGNKIFVGHNRIEIVNAVKKAITDKKFIQKLKRCKNPYGNGTATEKIIRILSNQKVGKELLVKSLTY